MSVSAAAVGEHYEAIVVGTGFAASFFLERLLEGLRPDTRVLVLERGRVDSLAWQVSENRSSSYDAPTFVNATPDKRWLTTIGFGGGSNCWWACTPRMLPNDFRLHSLYGVGRDWPVDYDDLAPHYDAVEAAMAMAGPEQTPFPRRGAYPQPPHALSEPDRILQGAYPGQVFAMPTARASRATRHRAACCVTSHCNICPVDAKFTIQNELASLYEDPRVTLRLGAAVQTVTVEAGRATGVSYVMPDGRERSARGDLVALGANAIANPAILLRSGIDHGPVGEGLNEQVGVRVDVYLDGLDSMQGGTSITAHAYNLYDGPHRSERAACLIELHNQPFLRVEPGRWREKLVMKCVFEDLREARNTVSLPADADGLPVTTFLGHSDYTQRAIERIEQDLASFLAPLPVEGVRVWAAGSTEGHILGTAVMGDDPDSSVVDRHLVHHKVRNLLVLGSSAFPSTAPANPTLTLSALSRWSATSLLAGD